MTHSNEEMIDEKIEVADEVGEEVIEQSAEDITAEIVAEKPKESDYQKLLSQQADEIRSIKAALAETSVQQQKNAALIQQQQLLAIQQKIAEAKENFDADTIEKAVRLEEQLKHQIPVQQPLPPNVQKFKVDNIWLEDNSLPQETKAKWLQRAQLLEAEYRLDHPGRDDEATEFASNQLRKIYPDVKRYDRNEPKQEKQILTTSKPITQAKPDEGKFDKQLIIKGLSVGQREYLLHKERKEGEKGVESYLKRVHAHNLKHGEDK